MDASTIAAEVERLGPWITGFAAHNQEFGGRYFAEYDTRIRAFLDWSGTRKLELRRVLECGCLEGGHTSLLASALPSAQIFASDVRLENIAKASLLIRIRNLQNVQFVHDDLDDDAKCLDTSYDAIVCVGLLYHLRDPARFLARCNTSAPVLWIWTVYCAEDEAAIWEDGFRGRIYSEPSEHPLSGVRPKSFFPTLGSLVEMLLAAGYQRVEIIEREITKNGNGPAVMLCATRPNP